MKKVTILAGLALSVFPSKHFAQIPFPRLPFQNQKQVRRLKQSMRLLPLQSCRKSFVNRQFKPDLPTAKLKGSLCGR